MYLFYSNVGNVRNGGNVRNIGEGLHQPLLRQRGPNRLDQPFAPEDASFFHRNAGGLICSLATLLFVGMSGAGIYFAWRLIDIKSAQSELRENYPECYPVDHCWRSAAQNCMPVCEQDRFYEDQRSTYTMFMELTMPLMMPGFLLYGLGNIFLVLLFLKCHQEPETLRNQWKETIDDVEKRQLAVTLTEEQKLLLGDDQVAEFLEQFNCSILYTLSEDPIFCKGRVYSRLALIQWIETQLNQNKEPRDTVRQPLSVNEFRNAADLTAELAQALNHVQSSLALRLPVEKWGPKPSPVLLSEHAADIEEGLGEDQSVIQHR